jgi:hypothetical protein
MSAPGKVINYLLDNDAGVSALVASRIYALRAPEAVLKPYLIIAKISDVRDLPIDATSGLIPCQARMQVSCFDASANGAKVLADAVRHACDLKSGTINTVPVSSVLWDGDSPDAYDFDVNLYHQPVDFLVHYYK